MKRFCNVFVSLLLSFACPLLFLSCTTTSPQVSASVPLDALSDEAYRTEFALWHKRASVNQSFQKKIDLEIVMLSDSMRRAYVQRWSQLRGDLGANIAELTSGKLAFVVSVFSPDADYMDLDNAALWTVQLLRGGEKLAPIAVKRLNEKSALLPFFPFVNHWTKETLIVFDASSSLPPQNVLVKPVDFVLEIKSALASVSFRW